jgi:HEAT repeat protein
MKKLITLVFFMSSAAMSQTPADSLNNIIDSLYIRASSMSVMYADLVQPSKKALADLGVQAVPALVEKMKTQDAREMQTLEEVFKLIGRPAVPFLVDALGSTENYTRRLSARIIGEMADSSAVEGLMYYTNDSDFRMRAGVIAALGKIGDSRGVQPSKLALQDKDYLVRTAAAISLSFLKEPSTIFSLLDALSDPYYGVRFSAAAAISNLGKTAVQPVLDALRAPRDTLSSYLLIEIAGNLKDDKLTESLTQFLDSNDPFARAYAAEALGKIGGGDALKALRKRYEIETHPLVISKIEAVALD